MAVEYACSAFQMMVYGLIGAAMGAVAMAIYQKYIAEDSAMDENPADGKLEDAKEADFIDIENPKMDAGEGGEFTDEEKEAYQKAKEKIEKEKEENKDEKSI